MFIRRHIFIGILSIIMLPYGIISYPTVFGTARYGRSTIPLARHSTSASSAWIPPLYSFAPYQTSRIHSQIAPNYAPSAYYAPGEALYSPYTQQDYLDEYYLAQEPITYPIYYAPAIRTPAAKHEIYQTLPPYYFDDRRARQPLTYSYYNFDESSDPVDDLQEEMLHENERNLDVDGSLPVGQETWYEKDSPHMADEENLDDVNAAFMQNLIAYNDFMKNKNDALKSKNMEGFISADDRDYFEDADANNWYPEETTNKMHKNYLHNEYDDENVKDLKKLQDQWQQQHNIRDESDETEQNFNRKQKHSPKSATSTLSMDPNDNKMWINWYNKRTNIQQNKLATNFANKKQELTEHGPWTPSYKKLTFNDRKNILTSKNSAKINTQSEVFSTSTQKPTSLTSSSTEKSPSQAHHTFAATKNGKGGQKEVVLLRPATPVRHPFAEPILKLLSQEKNKENYRGGASIKRTPSVYDTIKQLLNMEDNLKQKTNEENSLDDEPPQHNNIKQSNLQKRFVSNESSLVRELKELKKMST